MRKAIGVWKRCKFAARERTANDISLDDARTVTNGRRRRSRPSSEVRIVGNSSSSFHSIERAIISRVCMREGRSIPPKTSAANVIMIMLSIYLDLSFLAYTRKKDESMNKNKSLTVRRLSEATNREKKKKKKEEEIRIFSFVLRKKRGYDANSLLFDLSDVSWRTISYK